MDVPIWKRIFSRKEFLRRMASGALFSLAPPLARKAAAATAAANPLFWIRGIPDDPFYGAGGGNYHAGIDCLLNLMGSKKLKFYRSPYKTPLAGPSGMIAPDDVVLVKVNAQWKYRGCTNSDLVRGLVQRILDHPDGFRGEVVLFENGQGRGSLACDTSAAYGDDAVHANANDERQSFVYLVDTLFRDLRVSARLLDPVRQVLIGPDDHVTEGYRVRENVSYPCFTTAGGRRVELGEGIWQGSGYSQDLKLVNVPVLKDHGGSELTASLKHFYGILSMSDGQAGERHYEALGETCGKMVVSVRAPVLNILDAVWVSHESLGGYPASTTFRANQILASQDPVALDYWAAKYILYRIDGKERHHPSTPSIDRWLTRARDTINERGGLYDRSSGILVRSVTKTESEMRVHKARPRF